MGIRRNLKTLKRFRFSEILLMAFSSACNVDYRTRVHLIGFCPVGKGLVFLVVES